jgi:hypothetical protein
MDASGHFSITLPQNTHINPSGSKWSLTVCPLATFKCTAAFFIISTTPQDTSAGINAVIPTTTVNASPIIAYSYSEALTNPGAGSTFWNISTGQPEWWNPVTKAWTTGGGGGGSSVYVNGSSIGSPNFNGSVPSPDAGNLACTYKFTASNIITECPYGSTGSTFALGNAPIAQFTGDARVAQISYALSTPPAIGGTTPARGDFTTIGTHVSTGTSPFDVYSTTQVPNLNTSLLEAKTWEVPGTIGSTTPNTGAFTTLNSTGPANLGTGQAAHGSMSSEGAVPNGSNGLPACNAGLSGWWADSATHQVNICNSGTVIPTNNITLLTNGNGTIANAGPTSPISGNGGTQVVYTYTLPGNTLTSVGGLTINCGAIHNTGSGTVTAQITFGGSVLGYTPHILGNMQGFVSATIYNNAATNSQYYFSSAYANSMALSLNGGLQSGIDAVDTTSNVIITCGIGATVSDTVNGIGFEVIRKAQ